MTSSIRASSLSSKTPEEARLRERRLVMAAAAVLAATGDPVEVVAQWRSGLIREVRTLAIESGARAWFRRSGDSLIVRFDGRLLTEEGSPPSGPGAA